MGSATPQTWTAALALEEPRLFLETYFAVVGKGWGHAEGERPTLNLEDEAQLHRLYEVMDGVVRNSLFSDTLDLLRMGLEMCGSDLVLATFAAGPLEEFVVYRLKSHADTDAFEAAMRQDPLLMAAFKDGLVWGLDSLPSHVKDMLAKYKPN